MTHVAMVGDINFEAYTRLSSELNFAGYPSVFYDGGDTVGVGAPEPPGDEYYYRDRIEACGTRVVPDLDLLISMEHLSGALYEMHIKVGNGVLANYGPAIPSAINGPSYTSSDENNSFKVATIDPEAEELQYQFDWGNGVLSAWIGPFNSGDSCSADYIWTQDGSFDVKVRAKDIWDATSDWSPIHTVEVLTGCCIADRGNVDNGPDDGTLGNSVDISDLVFLVNFAFSGGTEPACLEEADIDGSGGTTPIDIADIVAFVAYMFTGGDAPVPCP